MLLWVYAGFLICFYLGRIFEAERQQLLRQRGTMYYIINEEMERMHRPTDLEKRRKAAEELRRIDTEIVKISREAAERIAKGTSFQIIEVDARFLRTLWRRRDVILGEYEQAGGTLVNANTFEVYGMVSELSGGGALNGN